MNLTRQVRESGFDLATLDYLLQHHATEAIDLQATDFTTRLREGLLQIAADHEFATDPTGTRTADILALIVPGEIVNRAMAMLNGTSQETESGTDCAYQRTLRAVSRSGRSCAATRQSRHARHARRTF